MELTIASAIVTTALEASAPPRPGAARVAQTPADVDDCPPAACVAVDRGLGHLKPATSSP
jgi:hypothetical protein